VAGFSRRYARGVNAVAWVAWTPLFDEGVDDCALLPGPTGPRMCGASARTAAEPMAAMFDLSCDESWATQSVRVRLVRPLPGAQLELRADGQGTWWRNGQDAPDLDGCIDVDLGCTPATNTLPIRRLDLAVGSEAEILAAWVRFPDLHVQPLRQRYRRLGPDRYEYSSNTFRAELTVDELGLVIDYQGAWERLTSSD
jgi:uncharacterized protein